LASLPAHQAEIAAASRKLDALIERYVYDAVRESDAGVARDSEHHSPMTRLIAGAVARAREGQGAELDARIEKIFADVANGLQLVGDVSAERAEQILGGLEEAGLLVRRHKVEELAEQMAQERLARAEGRTRVVRVRSRACVATRGTIESAACPRRPSERRLHP
jgi:hypothetical protein